MLRLNDLSNLSLSWQGALAGIASAVTFAFYLLASERLGKDLGSRLSQCIIVTISTVLLGIGLVWFEPQSIAALQSYDLQFWLVRAAISLGAGMFGILMLSASMRSISASTAGMITLLEIPGSVLIAIIFMHERLDMIQVLGIVLVIACSLLPFVEKLAAPKQAPEIAVLPSENTLLEHA